MSLANHLPSKKLSLVIILIVVGILIFIFKDKAVLLFQSKDQKAQEEFLNTKIQDFAVLDTDQDGLYDWEEALWGTDPKDKDSDNNDVDDKEEIEAKKKELGISDLPTENQENLTETERISMEMFTVFASLEQRGLLDDTAIENMALIFSEKISDPIEISDSSIKTDFPIIEDTAVNAKLYEKNVKKILEIAQNASVGKEMATFATLIGEPNKKNEKALIDISIAYAEMAEDLNKISVPKSISEIHKKIIINSTKVGVTIDLLKNYETDPVVATKGFVLYKDTSVSLEENIYSLLSYFQKNQ